MRTIHLQNLPMYKLTSLEKPAKLSLAEIERLIARGFDRELTQKDIQGRKIGVLAGSRGLRNIQAIIRYVVKYLQDHGAEVCILPAMGSHGGATDEGQRALLAHYGITEAEVGAPIVSSMKVTVIDNLEGLPVYVNSPVLELDYIVPVNRIKAHTDYHGPHESGLVKMLVIGMGKRAQAEAVHQHGIRGLRDLIPRLAEKIIARVPIFGAVALLENKWDETALAEVLNAGNLLEREKELLQTANGMLPQIPATNLDVLVVAQMGKNISGVGLDPNVTGRMRITGGEEYRTENPRRIAVCDLTEESDGNALGMGIADVITQRLYDKVDLNKTYVNTITSTFLERCFIPVIAPTDLEAVRIAVQTCGRVTRESDLRLAVIKNTLELSTLYISEALQTEATADYKIAGKISGMFDNGGNLQLSWDN